MSTQKKGILFSVLGGVFWGISGVCGQYLFDVKGLNAKWMVNLRLIIAGILMLVLVYRKAENRKKWKSLFLDWKNLWRLLLFSLFGMTLCQLSYFSTIEYSNAGTATVLQYTSPILIMVYVAFKDWKKPTYLDILALILALLGTFLLATHGNVGTLAISKQALFWGAVASVTMALYNLLPIKLMEMFGIGTIIGWSMLIGGICMVPVTKPWMIPGEWDIMTIMAFFAVVLVGTIMAFGVYFKGSRAIGAAKASLFASSEPLTATIAAAVFMHVSFMPMDVVGIGCIVLAVSILSLQKI